MSGGHGFDDGPALGSESSDELLTRFAPVRALGRGVLGQTYLAIQRGGADLRRFAIVKEIVPASDHAATELLERCRVAAYVQHHNLACVLDQSRGSASGRLRVVYEYVVGESLLSLLAAAAKQSQPLPAALAVRIVADCCAGLAAAHDSGDPLGRTGPVAHGALRPSNLLISYAGCVKLVDYGLADARRDGGPSSGQQTDIVAAQAHFMAPEQLAGAPPSPSADVYSAGVLLYTLLTLRYPHDAHESVQEVGRAKLEEAPVPPTLRAQHVQPDLERIVLRALAADPSERQRSAGELVADLESFCQRRQSTANTRSLADYLQSMFPQREQAKRKALRGLLAMPLAATFTERTAVDVFDDNLSQPDIEGETVLGEVPSEPPAAVDLTPAPQSSWREDSSTVVDAAPIAAAPSSLEISDDDVIASYTNADELEEQVRTERSAAMSEALDGKRAIDEIPSTEPPDRKPQRSRAARRPARDAAASKRQAAARPPAPGGGVFGAPTRPSQSEALAAARADRQQRGRGAAADAGESLTPEPALRRENSADVPEGTTIRAERDDSWYEAQRQRRTRRRRASQPTAVTPKPAAQLAQDYGDDETAVSLEASGGREDDTAAERTETTQRNASEERTEVGPNPNTDPNSRRRRS